jgi:23S rRNA pseudouridine1911/1915/1917 synthase
MLTHAPFDNTVFTRELTDIVYEDEALIANKQPPGLVVHPGHGNYTGTLVNALYHFEKFYR